MELAALFTFIEGSQQSIIYGNNVACKKNAKIMRYAYNIIKLILTNQCLSIYTL